jgi:DNA-binding response OmpR family regulator
LRILHIEDDPFQQQIVRLHLTSLPAYETTIVAVVNEQQALQAFRSQSFDVVLLDYHLTEGNGLACLRRLRELDSMVPILVISGLTEPHVAAELLQSGADDFLSKENLVGDRLTRTLTALLARSDGLKARLPLREQGGQLSPDQLDLLRYLQRLRDALQGQHFAVGRVQRAVDRFLFELQGDEFDLLPRKELLEFFLRLLACSDETPPTEQNGQ